MKNKLPGRAWNMLEQSFSIQLNPKLTSRGKIGRTNLLLYRSSKPKHSARHVSKMKIFITSVYWQSVNYNQIGSDTNIYKSQNVKTKKHTASHYLTLRVSSYKEELTAKSQTAVLPVLTFKKKIDVTNLTVFPSKKKTSQFMVTDSID